MPEVFLFQGQEEISLSIKVRQVLCGLFLDLNEHLMVSLAPSP